MRVGATVVFLISKCTPRQHANSARWSRVHPCQLGHGLSDISRVLYDIMLKDMCQAHELDSQTTAECVTQDRSLDIN